MKVSTENDNNFGYENTTIVVDNIPLNHKGDTYCVTDLTVKLIVCDKNQSIVITLMIQLYVSIT